MIAPLSIRGFGIATAAGECREATMERLATGESLITRHDAFFDSSYENLTCVFAQSKNMKSTEQRMTELFLAAWSDCFAASTPTGQVRIIILLPQSDPLTGMEKQRVIAASRGLHTLVMEASKQAKMDVQSYDFVNKGQAGLGIALQMAQTNPDGDTIIVGADSYCDRLRLSSSSRAGLLFSSRDKWGFIPGEAGGAIWVSPLPQETNSPTVLSAWSDREAISEREPSQPSDHSGLSRAVRSACEAAGQIKASRWLSDMNNSRYRASELAYAVHRATPFWLTGECDVVHVPMTFGECGCAYGFLALMGAVNRACDAVTLVSSGDEFGTRAAFLIRS